MEDIIYSIPWEDDGWFLASYWQYEDGTYSVDNYTDGDHETIEAEELPTPEEIDEAWGNYYLFCLETGTEPLNDSSIQKEEKRKQKYKAVLKEVNSKFIIKSVHEIHKKKNILIKTDKLSFDVKLFLLTEDGINSTVTKAELKTDNSYCEIINMKNHWIVNFEIDVSVPIAPKIVKTKIKEFAIRQLKNKHLNKLRAWKLSRFDSVD